MKLDLDVIEPQTIDEARLQMVHQLHRALFGDTWARPGSPVQVWSDLIERVETISRACRR